MRVGTRPAWTSGDPGPVVESAHELADAGADTLAVFFGDEHGFLDRMSRFHALFTGA